MLCPFLLCLVCNHFDLGLCLALICISCEGIYLRFFSPPCPYARQVSTFFWKLCPHFFQDLGDFAHVVTIIFPQESNGEMAPFSPDLSKPTGPGHEAITISKSGPTMNWLNNDQVLGNERMIWCCHHRSPFERGFLPRFTVRLWQSV